MKSGWTKQDFAYSCFLFWALTVLGVDVVMASFTEVELAQGAGAILLVFLPVLAAAYIAMVVGIVLSIGLWRHWPLTTLSAASILRVATYFTESVSTSFQAIVSLACCVGVSVMCGWWFLSLRKRHVSPSLPLVRK